MTSGVPPAAEGAADVGEAGSSAVAHHPAGAGNAVGASAALLLILVCAYAIGSWTFRWAPSDLQTVVALLFPLALLPWLPGRGAARTASGAPLILAALTVCWTIAGILFGTYPHLALGRAAMEAGALVIALAVATSVVAPERWIQALGIGTTCALAVAWVGMTVTGSNSFGMGNVNFLMSAATPVLCGWIAWLVRSPAARSRWSWLWPVAAVSLWLAFVVTAYPGQLRRGALAAATAAAIAVVMIVLWQRHRRSAIVILGVGAGIVAVATWHWLHGPLQAPRHERLMYFAAAWEGAMSFLPFGGGSYAAIALNEVDGEHARHLTAAGHWLLHVHNEGLEALLNGGVIGLALLAAFTVALIRHVGGIIDPAQRWACTAALAAGATHALSDNSLGYAGPLAWAAVGVGVMLRCPSTRTAASGGMRCSARLLAWPCALFAAYGATRSFAAAFLHYEATPAVRIATIRQTNDPQVAYEQSDATWNDVLPSHDWPAARSVLTAVERKLGPANRAAFVRLGLAEVDGHAAAERFIARWPFVSGGSTPLDAGAALALCARSDRATYDAAVYLIARRPFTQAGYDALARLLRRRPDQLAGLPQDLRRRLSYLTGFPDPPQTLPAIVDLRIDAAIDLHGAVRCALRMGLDPRPLVAPSMRLARSYGDIPEVARLVCEVASASGSTDLHACAADVVLGLRHSSDTDLAAILARIDTAAAARAAWPIISGGRPELAVTPWTSADYRDVDDLRMEAARIRGLLARDQSRP
ncbi:MAG: hypothetical protein H0V44_15705 [Planctomycetes bacterium]|nr:hypothetical protein [Planctomycetota bacterium]